MYLILLPSYSQFFKNNHKFLLKYCLKEANQLKIEIINGRKIRQAVEITY